MVAATHVAQADILEQVRVNAGLLDDLLADLEDKSVERSILQSTLESLAQRCSDSQGNDNIIGVLLEAFMNVSKL